MKSERELKEELRCKLRETLVEFMEANGQISVSDVLGIVETIKVDLHFCISEILRAQANESRRQRTVREGE